MKKALSLILALIMVTAVLPLNAFAIEEKKPIGEIVIILDDRIAGKTPGDLKDFLTVSGEGVEIDEDSFETKHRYYLINGFPMYEDAEVFEEGETYYSTFRIYPKENYIMPMVSNNSENISYKIIKSKGTVEVGYNCTSVTSNGEYADYYEMKITYTVEAPDPTGIARIPFLIARFYESALEFFVQTFIQPIADVIVEILNKHAK